MKICMIGCGNFARDFHGPAQRRCAASDPEIRLAACCDVEEDRAQHYREAFGFARHYTNVSAMLDTENPDAVVLAVPPAITCAVATTVLARGFPLLLEKPPGLDAEELARLIAAATQGRAHAQVGFNRRHMPVMRSAKAILDTAFAGTPIVHLDYEMLRYDRWDLDFTTTAVHALDAVRFLAGPLRRAQIHYRTETQPDRSAVCFSLELECASGARVQARINPVAECNAELARIHALGQSLVIRLPFLSRSSAPGTVEHWRAGELVSSYRDAADDLTENMGILGETQAFLDAVRAGHGFTPTLEDCFEQVTLMEAMRLRCNGSISLQRCGPTASRLA